jgi:hypothetical protein
VNRRAPLQGLAALAGLLMAPAAWAQVAAPEPPPAAHDTPWSLQTQLAPVHLPGGERMGLWTQSWLLALDEHWWLGPSVAAAATGQRGGLFVLGAQATRRWSLDALGMGDRQWLEASLYAGGGGGAGAPVGGGLMLMPSVAWLRDWGGWQAGLSWSRVKFPSGRIGSSQLGLVLQWDGRLRWWDVADVGAQTAALGAGWDDGPGATANEAMPGLLGWQALQLDAAVLHLRSGTKLGMVGARAERDGPGAWRWTLETAAATHGGADGYMEMLAGALWRWPLAGPTAGTVAGADAGGQRQGPSLSGVPTVGLRAALGLGGGGAVPTGGGLIGKAAVQMRLPLAWLAPVDAAAFGGAQFQLEAGLVAGPGGRTGGAPDGTPGAAGASAQGSYRARYLQASLGWDLDAASHGGALALHGWRTSASWQRQTHVARKQGSAASLDTIGLKLAQDDGRPCYLTAQAHSAVAGGAGAYSLGLVGAGCATPATSQASPWRVGAEALVGAAGGGGVATRGGAVAAGQLWLQRASGPDTAWQLGLGRLRSLKPATPGEPVLDTPVVDVSWSMRFGQLGGR